MTCVVCAVREATKGRRLCNPCRYGRAKEAFPDITCKKCGDVFRPTHKGQQYCSVGCSISDNVPVKHLVCEICGAPYEFKGRTTRRLCLPCWNAKRSRQATLYCSKKNPGMKVGVGSGGAQWGPNNHKWDPDSEYHGRQGYLVNYRRICLNLWINACIVCGEDSGTLHVHHINGVRADYRESNLIPLCRRCHAKFHAHHRKIGRPSCEEAFYAWLAYWIAEVKSGRKSGTPMQRGIRGEG